MNVYLYVGMVIILGLIASYFIGRLPSRLGLIAAILVFVAASISLGILLSFPLLQATARVCKILGYGTKACIATDDRTVWALAFPLAAFPVYFLVMLYFNRAKIHSGEDF